MSFGQPLLVCRSRPNVASSRAICISGLPTPAAPAVQRSVFLGTRQELINGGLGARQSDYSAASALSRRKFCTATVLLPVRGWVRLPNVKTRIACPFTTVARTPFSIPAWAVHAICYMLFTEVLT